MKSKLITDRVVWVRLGDYIKRSTINNKDLVYGTEFIEGVSNEGKFSQPKGSLMDIDLQPYKIVENGAFVYNPSRLNLGSIAYRTEGLCIVSHLYIVFYLNESGKKRINPEYLFMYFRRDEFYREVTFRNFGSQRPEFNFNDMSEILIPLPSLEVQNQYVDIYKAMYTNLRSYEQGLQDLKLICDSYIEDLRRKLPCEKLKKYISRVDIRNGKNGTKNVKGISVYKQFRDPTAKVNLNELSNYKVVQPRQIGFVQTTHNEKVFAYAFNSTGEDIVISSVNEVFKTNEGKLLPEYLCMFFNRTEFDRYARFHSWGSARETFTWDDLIEVEIPVPDLLVQKSIADIYKVYELRKSIQLQLKTQLKNICSILIRGSLEE